MAVSFFVQTRYGLISNSRSVLRLEDVCVPKVGVQTGPFGSQLHNSDYADHGVPIITVEHIGDHTITGDSMPLVKPQDAKRLEKYSLRAGDVVFSRVGSVDRSALVSWKEEGWLFSGRLLRVRPNPSLADAGYLSYFFQLPRFKARMRLIAVGATMPSLNTAILKDVEVILPELAEQVAIRKILEVFDKKIETNRQLSRTLEGIAQTIFKSWFIDFDPVKAKMSGGNPVGMDAATAVLFPESMEDSELGLIPEGWEISTVGNFCPFAYGKALPARVRNPGSVSVFGSNGVVGVHNSPLLRAPTIVVGRKGTVGTVNISLKPCWVIDTAFSSSPNNQEDLYLAYFTLQSLKLEEMNSDGAVPGLNRENVHRLQAQLGTEQVRKVFARVVTPIFEDLFELQHQSQTLIAIRDSLLPLLISGKLQIPGEMLVS